MAAVSPEVASLAKLLGASRRAVVFTGAGISTESGIPDFRSPGGIWTRMAPIDFQDFVASAEMRKEAWRRRFAMEEMFASVKPNVGHMAIAELVAQGRVQPRHHAEHRQSASGFRRARRPGHRTARQHALCQVPRLRRARRTRADPRHFEAHGVAPDCRFCGGTLKTATISFGQAMPEAEMARAERRRRACDLFLVLGTSLVVYPAAGFPVLAKRHGARLVIVNREPTPQDGTGRPRDPCRNWPTLQGLLMLNGR